MPPRFCTVSEYIWRSRTNEIRLTCNDDLESDRATIFYFTTYENWKGMYKMSSMKVLSCQAILFQWRLVAALNCDTFGKQYNFTDCLTLESSRVMCSKQRTVFCWQWLSTLNSASNTIIRCQSMSNFVAGAISNGLLIFNIEGKKYRQSSLP